MVTKEIEIEEKKKIFSKDCFIFHSNRKEYCIPKKKMIILQISKNSFVYEILSRSVRKIEYCAPKIETPEMRIFFFHPNIPFIYSRQAPCFKNKTKTLSKYIYIYIHIYLFIPNKIPHLKHRVSNFEIQFAITITQLLKHLTNLID